MYLKSIFKLLSASWSEWGPWQNMGFCSKSCGGGTIIRERIRWCSDGPTDCEGSDVERKQVSCNTQQCPGTYL